MKTLTDLGIEDLKALIEGRSPSGFWLKRLILTAKEKDAPAINLAVTQAWMNTCGFPVYTIDKTVSLDSPVQGFGPFLRGNTGFYLEMEKTFGEVVRSWSPKTLEAAKIPFLTFKKIQRVKTKGKIYFAQKLEPDPKGIILKRTIEINEKLALDGLTADHPLLMTLAGHKKGKDVSLPESDIEEVIEEDCFYLRLEEGSEEQKTLAKLAAQYE